MDQGIAEVIEDTSEYISVTIGIPEWIDSRGRFYMEKDYRVAGEVWRVHKYDADPFPSRPHAHCIAGAQRYMGYKLHLGTAELYRNSEASGRYLSEKQFKRLIELIRPKFPGLTLPLP